MMDREKRSVTWLCNTSFFDKHNDKKCSTVSTACRMPQFPFYFLLSAHELWGRDKPEGLEKRGNAKILITKNILKLETEY